MSDWFSRLFVSMVMDCVGRASHQPRCTIAKLSRSLQEVNDLENTSQLPSTRRYLSSISGNISNFLLKIPITFEFTKWFLDFFFVFHFFVKNDGLDLCFMCLDHTSYLLRDTGFVIITDVPLYPLFMELKTL